MKQEIIIRILILITSFIQISLQAQTKKIHAGISIGILTSDQIESTFANNVYNDPDLNLGSLRMSNFNSGNIAIPVYYELSKKFSLQSGIGYTLRKYNTTGKYIPNDITYNYYSSLHVIELPLSFHYKIKLADKISLIPSIGYSMDIVTSPRYIYLYEAGTPYTANYDYVKMGYSERRVLNSMLLALGYETDLLKKGKIRFTYTLHFNEGNSFYFLRGNNTTLPSKTSLLFQSFPITYSMLSITYILPYSFGLRKL